MFHMQEGKTHCRVIHEWLDDSGIEASIELAAEDRRGDIEAAADLPLSETVNVLREVVCELPPFAGSLSAALRRERIGCDYLQVEEKARHERGDERGRGSEARLVDICEPDCSLVEWR